MKESIEASLTEDLSLKEWENTELTSQLQELIEKNSNLEWELIVEQSQLQMMKRLGMQRSDSKDPHMFDDDDLLPSSNRMTMNSNLKDELD